VNLLNLIAKRYGTLFVAQSLWLRQGKTVLQYIFVPKSVHRDELTLGQRFSTYDVFGFTCGLSRVYEGKGLMGAIHPLGSHGG
jgi:hypothetical protein